MSRILISGCGFSYSKQSRKTWANVLQSAGVKIVDVGGPAVSNQYILNKTILELENKNDYDHVIIQLTSLGKLDVKVDDDRFNELVKTDSHRNFLYKELWPSSHSSEHLSKQLYYKWLYSEDLELEDIICKLLLLQKTHKNILIVQAYGINYPTIAAPLTSMFYNFNKPLMDMYIASDFYKLHDHADNNTVPCLEYHVNLAYKLGKYLQIPHKNLIRLENINNKLN